MAETYVVFNVLQRGIWKNRKYPIITRHFANVGKTPTDNSPYPPQNYRRQSSVVTSKYYEYNKSVDRSNKIAFGYDKNATLDLANVASMPFKEPDSLSYSNIKNQTLSLKISRIYSKDYPFSQYASKFSKDYGIFYGYRTEGGSIRDISWKGVSIAEKDSLPTIKRFSTSSDLTYVSANLFTKSISFMGSTSQDIIYIYPSHVYRYNTGSNYYFDESDRDCKVKYVYIITQGCGGDGPKSYRSSIFAYRGSSGGGAGCYSVNLVKIPENGYIIIYLPPVPDNAWNPPANHRNGDINVFYHDNRTGENTLLISTLSGDWGYSASHDGNTDGGKGGSDGNPGSIYKGNVCYKYDIISIKGVNGHPVFQSSKLYQQTETGERSFVGPGYSDVISLPKVVTYWGGEGGGLSQSYNPGIGGSSYFGPGGLVHLNSSGRRGSIGAGGGGAWKQIFDVIAGGPGGGPYVTIGY